jgi:serine/threonine protein kinase
MTPAAALLPIEFPDGPVAFGDYLLLSRIADGGMGIVLRALDRRDNQLVAIKLARSARPADATAIRREVAALREVDHPGIVRLYDDGVWNGTPWMAMELLDGLPLNRVIGATPRPTDAGKRLVDMFSIMRPLCLAITHLHDRGMIHRDIKPSNVMVGEGGRVTLYDFGLACRVRDLAQDGSRNNICMGTMEYAAPEQIWGGAVDARADIYSLGCVLYELVTGRRPFDAESAQEVARQHLHLEPRAPSQLVADLPRPLEELLLQMLAKRPEGRPKSCLEVGQRLAAIVAGRAPYQMWTTSSSAAAVASYMTSDSVGCGWTAASTSCAVASDVIASDISAIRSVTP